MSESVQSVQSVQLAMAAIVGIVRELERADDAEAALQRISDAVLPLLDADHASIRLCDAEAELRSIARSGVGTELPAPSFRRGQGLMGWVAQTGQIARVSDSPADARFERVPGRGFEARSVMSIPLTVGDRVLGVLSVSAARPGVFTEDHEHAGVVVAHCISQALRCSELERQATTDPLTRAYNRSRLLPCLESEMNRARREGHPLSVLLMDLDHFKRVNDRYGHAVGDAVLCSFADIVRGSTRSFDVLIRRGGEEFELVMPATGTVDGWKVAERIRNRLSAKALQVGDALIQQTVSIGLATWDGRESAQALDERADLAMYTAKRMGRDRIVAAKMPRTPPATPRSAEPELTVAR